MVNKTVIASTRAALTDPGIRSKVVTLLRGTDVPDLCKAKELLLAFAMQLGRCLPHTVSPDSLIWDIKAEVSCAPQGNTFSKHNLEASFHTDSQYAQVPEECVILYCHKAARCKGGENLLLDFESLNDAILSRLSPNDQENLHTVQYPFVVPDAYIASHGEVLFAPILSPSPHLRFRFDTLEAGWRRFGKGPTSDEWISVIRLNQLIRELPAQKVGLAPGQALVINNHSALHARSAFTDFERHLLRVRLNPYKG